MNETSMNTGHESENPVDDDEISLLDLGIVLAKHKQLIVGLPTLVAVLAIVYALFLPNVYTGTTKILPPQQGQSSASAMLAQLGGLAGMAGGIAGIKNPSDMYIGMFKSRTVLDSMVQRFDLMNYYATKFPSQARAALEGSTKISAGKDGIISIEVDDKDPKRAAEMANGYIEELRKLTKVLAVTEASQRRLFFEQQFNQAKDNLAKAEIVARQALDKGGLSNVDAQGRALIETTARLRGQISVKEVQIGAMRGYAAERNPDLIKAQQELAALKNQLIQIEGSSGDRQVSNGQGSGLDNLRLLRDLKYYETIYEMLAKQFEMAKIDEAKDSTLIQVLDVAIEPDHKSKPKRAMIVILATLAAGFIGILAAFIREALAKAGQDPVTAQRLQTLRQYLAWRR
jgi:tyrosine-protein kinase Etk/Wzc